MKDGLKFPLYAAFCFTMTWSIVSCEDDNSGVDDGLTPKEQTLQKAAGDFVDKTVLPVYSELADAGIELFDACETMQTAFEAGNLTTEMVRAAGQKWKDARKYWELSEAFLYGAAGDYNIDPHIDSWPLNGAELQALLNDPVRMGKMDDDYAGNYLGYGLLGFHALEYMLFEDGGARALNKYTSEELVYTVAVAGDLRNQCVRLEASWAGLDHVTSAKKTILADAELDPSFDYGASMKNAGEAGSKYKNYLEAAQEIVEGCITIADEVGNQKIGRPANGSAEADKNYIESPYSHNSLTDFEDNIVSIRNAYTGTNSGDASVSAFIKSVAPETDTKVREAIDAAIASIRAIPAPFVSNAGSGQSRAAVTACGTTLVEALEEAQQALLK